MEKVTARALGLTLVALLAACDRPSVGPSYDVLLKGGWIVDGTGQVRG